MVVWRTYIELGKPKPLTAFSLDCDRGMTILLVFVMNNSFQVQLTQIALITRKASRTELEVQISSKVRESRRII